MDPFFDDFAHAALSSVAGDPGDTQAEATALTEGTWQIESDGYDWFKVESLDGEIALSMSPTGDTARDGRNVNIELRNSAGQAIGSSFTPSGDESFSRIVTTPGTYYVRAYDGQYVDNPPDGFGITYSLSIDLPEADPNDGNNTRGEADLLSRGITTFSGSKEDWHRIETGPGPVSLEMRPTGEIDLNLSLFNESGERIAIDWQSSGPESVQVAALTEGVYFARVFAPQYQATGAPNGISLDYTLQLDMPRDSWVSELGLGPVRNASVGVYDIDRDGEMEIVVGASKLLDDAGNEIAPGGLAVFEADGTKKWVKTFDAFPSIDPATGKSYETTSVTTAPTFSDVNGDGSIDIIVGVGGVNEPGYNTVGQPGDDGGVYAVDADGNTLWFHQTNDRFGDEDRPDGVYGAPRVYDIDRDGVREVLFTSWDHGYYVLDGRTGAVEQRANLHDTAGATPAVADLDGDGLNEVLVPSDISRNPDAGLPQQGGVLHAFNAFGQQVVPGWDGQIASSTSADYRGKFDEQSLWSSPVIGDLDRDGRIEIIQGTGDFFKDDRGTHVKVWNADGTLRHTLETNGRVMAAPMLADLDGDGRDEIVAATTNGWVHAFNADGTQLFAVQPKPFNGSVEAIINRQPIAVDLDNRDGDLELLISKGGQIIAIDSDGTQLNAIDGPGPLFGAYVGSPVAHDLDGDGRLDIVAAGTDPDSGESVLYRFDNILDARDGEYRTAAYQDNQSLHEIKAFVGRFYETILGRDADAQGSNAWTDRLHTGVMAGADVARSFIGSPEFQGRNTSDEDYVTTLYRAFFDRAPDSGGFSAWVGRLEDGISRDAVLDGFIGSREFANLAQSFGIETELGSGRPNGEGTLTGSGDDTDVLRAGDGSQTLVDGTPLIEATSRDEADVTGQVYRLYGSTLGREPDTTGFQNWIDAIAEGRVGLVQAAGAFAGSPEFQQRYGDLENSEFVNLLYQNVLGRDADAIGLTNWTARLDGGMSRAEVVVGFAESTEYRRGTQADLDDYMRTANKKWTDVLEGGAGDDRMNGGTGADVFIFRRDAVGSDTIHGFEPWDELQFSRYGYSSGADARARMSQDGDDVVFADRGQTIRFVDMSLADMRRVRFNVS
ncbi:DUF4214 domain-containing protein [Jannaschia aquimarina]|uniref:FG-GAP repeat protein n=1 Tax=Jannaschia aquimarina TaxID=935700 RepID=A0A0D1CK69_9RHOB|nr:DUF4214 domain-containing protein [Jannaschia aquimarina]KIT15142.1 FG-GAP repeat protein [Jannaschia aquimarina]SNS65253.1 Repeat domain-containing protein [Jannaschia aquimarina]